MRQPQGSSRAENYGLLILGLRLLKSHCISLILEPLFLMKQKIYIYGKRLQGNKGANGGRGRKLNERQRKHVRTNQSHTHVTFPGDSEDNRNLKDAAAPAVLRWGDESLGFAGRPGCPPTPLSPFAAPGNEGAVIPKIFGAYFYHE